MKYDPIMCMMVDDSAKTKDEEYKMKVTSYVINKGQSGEYYGLKNKETNQVLYSAPNNWKSREGAKRWAENKGMIYVEDSSTIDKAIRNCDEEKKENYPELTISNARVGSKYAYTGGWIKLTKVWKMSEKEMKEKGLNYPWRFEGITNNGYKEGAALTH